MSGDILAVGAYKADPEGLANAGAAYLYRLEANGSASFLSKVMAPDKVPGDEFGLGVSLLGNTLAIGAIEADPEGVSGAGALYLYSIEANGSVSF